MPVPSQFGVLAGHGSSAPGFVTQHTYSTAAGSQSVSFSGASAGNLALVIATNAGVATPAGWTAVSSNIYFGTRLVVSYKVLTGGDIATGSVNITGLSADATVVALFYSGPAAAAFVSGGSTAGGTTLSIPGFTKAVGSLSVVTYAVDVANNVTMTAPGLAIARITPIATPGLFYTTGAGDITPASGYTNGTALVWSSLSNIASHFGEIIELT